jgi:capsule polysaccharide export protein KpsC/LpsZ
VFYPLHFEPEATLYYLSPFYDNQFALIENVLKCMKESQVLIIKEHPAQPGFLMQKHFRKLKSRFPNIKFLKADVPSLTVINRANYIFTLVSTAGFEAMCLEKPVIVFGKVYYNSYPGVNYCKTFDEVYDLLRGHKQFNKSNELEDFISRMFSILHSGYPWPYSTLYNQDNIRNVRMGIESKISI